jgi:hypothetical protein
MVSKTRTKAENRLLLTVLLAIYYMSVYSIDLFMNASGPDLHLQTISQSVCLLFYLQKGGGQKKHVTCKCQIHFLGSGFGHRDSGNSVLGAEMNLKLACNAYFPDMFSLLRIGQVQYH